MKTATNVQSDEAKAIDIAKSVERAITAERERVATWMIAQNYATGRSDTIEDLLVKLEG